MHEFSLAQGLTQQLLELAANHRAEKVLRVHLAVGSTAGVVLDSFRFAFEVLSAEQNLLTGCLLDIEEVQPEWRCPVCGPLATDDDDFGVRRCPKCGCEDLIFRGGSDITLLRVELDLPEPS